VLAAAALLAVGCSGDEPPDRVDADVTRDGLGALFAGDHPGDRETAAGRCFARELTDRVPRERLREAGVLDASYGVVADLPPLPAGIAEDWARAQLACTDFVAESTRAQVTISKGRIDAERYAGCLRRTLDEAELEAAVAGTLAGDWDAPAVASLGAAQARCARASMPPDPR
jgi:hypothetical protein